MQIWSHNSRWTVAQCIVFYCPSCQVYQKRTMYGFNTTVCLPRLNQTFSLAFSLHLLLCRSTVLLYFLSTMSFSFPLHCLSTHSFHILPLSFSILTCLAYLSVTVKLLLFFSHRPAPTLPAEYDFSPLIIISTAAYSISFALSLFTLMKFLSHPPPNPDPGWSDTGGVLRRLPRVLHDRGADGVDQTDGGGVLARDGGLHWGGLAPGLQLSGVKKMRVVKWVSSGLIEAKKRKCLCKMWMEKWEEFREDGFTDMNQINVVIRANLLFILVLSFHSTALPGDELDTKPCSQSLHSPAVGFLVCIFHC